MEDALFWVWLSSLKISPKARYAVICRFGTAETAFASEKGSFRDIPGVTLKEAEDLEARDLSDAKRALAECRRQQIDLIPINTSEYPERLRQIDCPPTVLFIQGIMPAVDELPVISVIGTRHASPYGEKMGMKLASEISACGGTVLSLLTSGVDEAAARGALMSGKPGIAVLGTSHEKLRTPLRSDFHRQGVLISEYPPGRESARHFFRERNRIAAGLSVGVVVVEAPEHSGTRLFVQTAVEQGKDIFAVPANADAQNSSGTLSLLKEGAKLVTDGYDVMEEYEYLYPGLAATASVRTHQEAQGELKSEARRQTVPASSSDGEEKADSVPGQKSPPVPQNKESTAIQSERVLQKQLSGLTEDQLRILSAISGSSSHIDDIADEVGLSTAKVLAQLTFLEIKGYVRREAGRRFSLNIIRTEK
ncbi:MAG: DNA-protecting protein DprA [Oscillospiraceae bacterium]|nr:DNA-protecting protein DprA [Oscillospiraceae bacterium]